mmetsp:Transcript_25691/g.61185  ORF Transcript_25691/g.61185 Transcript_25691/m.61185 type:complete len:99 (-) Transcript_25691:18-314(-)
MGILAGARGTVAAFVSGHQHEGGMHTDAATGIHHIVLESPLLSDPEHPGPYAVLEAYEDRLVLVGNGATNGLEGGLFDPASGRCHLRGEYTVHELPLV